MMDADTELRGSPLLRIRLWGPFRVEKRVGEGYEAVKTADWGGSNYPRLLLKALLCCPGRRARRESLLDMLWPEIDGEQATAYLNTATTKLRQLLRQEKNQESLLITEHDATVYHLPDQRVLWVDSDAVQYALAQAERVGRTSLEAFPLLEEALAGESFWRQKRLSGLRRSEPRESGNAIVAESGSPKVTNNRACRGRQKPFSPRCWSLILLMKMCCVA